MYGPLERDELFLFALLMLTFDPYRLTVYRHRRVLESDSDALARARAEATAAADPNGSDADSRKSKHREGRRELATDEMALARFKKRQQQQWGK